MTKILLHIGTHKTATTSIQRMFAAAGQKLAAERVLYPEKGRPDTQDESRFGHHLLAWSLRRRGGHSGDHSWSEVLDDIAQKNPRLVILSSEVFAPASADEISHVCQLLAPFPVEVVVYVRDPTDMMLSVYKQFVRVEGTTLDLRTFTEKYEYLTDYRAVHVNWSASFGTSNVTVRLYDECKHHPGILRDFLSVAGLDVPHLIPCGEVQYNVSPPDYVLAMLKIINRLDERYGRTGMPGWIFPRIRRRLLHKSSWCRLAAGVLRPITRKRLYQPDDIEWLRSRFEDRLSDMAQLASQTECGEEPENTKTSADPGGPTALDLSRVVSS